MAVTLHTKDLPMVLKREFYDDLIENFDLIEKALNGDTGSGSGESAVDNQIKSLESRINNIVAGQIDQVALDSMVDQAVNDALKRKGVI